MTKQAVTERALHIVGSVRKRAAPLWELAQKRKVRWAAFALAVLAVAGMFYLLNVFTPYFHDDYAYAFSWATGERIQSFSDVIQSQLVHYQQTNGRFVAHTLVQCFMALPKGVFNAVNVLAYFLLVGLLYLHSAGTFRKFHMSWFILLQVLLWFVLPAFGESLLWLSGSGTYLYGFIFVLAALLPFRWHSLYCSSTIKQGGGGYKAWLACVPVFLLGIAGGNSGENGSAGMLVLMVLYLLRFCWKEGIRRVPPQLFAGLLGGLLGFAALVASPGQWMRMDYATEGSSSTGILAALFRLIQTTPKYFVYLAIPLLAGAFLAILIWKQQKQSRAALLANALLYVAAGAIPLFVITVVIGLPDRAWAAAVMLTIIAVGQLYCSFDWETAVTARQLRAAALAVACVAALGSYAQEANKLLLVKGMVDQQIVEINQAKAQGETTVVLQKIITSTKYSVLFRDSDVSQDATAWKNVVMAKYYGLAAIEAIEREDYLL